MSWKRVAVPFACWRSKPFEVNRHIRSMISLVSSQLLSGGTVCASTSSLRGLLRDSWTPFSGNVGSSGVPALPL